MQKISTISLNKLQIATAELDTAIYHFFIGDDDISVHTLCMASHEIIGKLVKNKNGQTVTDTIFNSIKKQYKKEAYQKFISAYNGFKHANRGLTEKITFDPDMNELVLQSSVMAIKSYFPENLTSNMMIFILWIEINRKEYFLEEIQVKIRQLEKGLSSMISLSKKDFFEKSKIFLQ